MRFSVIYMSAASKRRTINEDSILLCDTSLCEANLETPIQEVIIRDDCATFCACDGMGGHKNGEKASRVIVETFAALKPSDKDSLENAIKEANKKLAEAIAIDSDLIGFGATIAGALIKQKSALVFHCGDSRVYRFNGAYLERLTRDYSFVQSLIDSGEIDDETARLHPNRNVVTSAMTGKEPLRFTISEFAWQKELELFICSDGVWELFEIEELERLASEVDLTKLNLHLRQEANDNYSFIKVGAYE
jgi:protein phosphatase